MSNLNVVSYNCRIEDILFYEKKTFYLSIIEL